MSEGEWWHGGAHRLKPGDLILPPTETGIQSGIEFAPNKHTRREWGRVIRRDRVYVAAYLTMAGVFAAFLPDELGRGWCYRVRPLGELEEDPDWHGEPELSMMTTKAQVVRAHPLTPRECDQIRRRSMV